MNFFIHLFSPMPINFPAKFIQPILQYFSNIFLAYRCHKTQHVHVPLTIQNLYMHHCHNTKHVHYHCHNTKHIHVPLSQYKTCSLTTVTIRNMHTYHCHNTQHVHITLSQYETCTRTTGTIQNMFTYHCHNTKHVHAPLSQYRLCHVL